jgi:hypothetical protein
MKGAKVVKTENGWEPAFWQEHFGEYVVEPGFAKRTKREAEAALAADLAISAACVAAERLYQGQYAYAAGYHN